MKKPFLFALGLVAVTVAACGGKVVVESGTGGAGGTSTSLTTADGAPDPVTNVAAVTVGASAVAAASVTTGTGTTTCDPSNTCAAAITPPDGDPTKLCDNTLSAKLYDALVQCTCVDVCQVQCASSVCISGSPGPTCAECLQDPVNGCGNQLASCTNDV